MSQADAFEQSLAYLLPEGLAWPRDPSSVWMRLLGGVAGTLSDLHDFTAQATEQWLPQLTQTRLEEWEQALGLPDPCFGPNQTFEQRRAAVLARLRGFMGAYWDSSPASIGSIQAYCDALGLDATVTYNTPFRVGRDRVGRRLGMNDGQLYITISGTSTLFRVGVNRVGARLVDRPAEVAQLVCALDSVVPARFAINVVLT